MKSRPNGVPARCDFISIFEQLEDRVLFDGVPDATFVLPENFAVESPAPIDAQMVQQASQQSAVELIIVDGGVEDSDVLIRSILEQSPDRTFEIRILDTTTDGVAQITDILSRSNTDFDAIHILSHGNEGQVNLGNTTLSSANLVDFAEQMAGWAGALSADADLLFYGCDLAGNAAGEQFIESISAITGADVAASDDLTGAAELGGDWDLELNVGTVETASLTAENWNHTLLDTDGDGLDDADDSDDDNDGILDTEEGLQSFSVESGAIGSAAIPINGGDLANLDTGDVFVSPGVIAGFDVRVEIVEVNTTSANARVSSGSGALFLDGTGDNEISYLAYELSVVEAGSVTINNLDGNAAQLVNAEVVIGDIDARSGFNFSDVGGVDTATGSTPTSVTTGSELTSFSYPAGTGAASFETFVLDTFGTSESDTTDPRFAITITYDNFESGTFLHGVTGVDADGDRGSVYRFSGEIIRDTDGDGIGDHQDLDSDNDGISDLVESGANAPAIDTNGDGIYDGAVDPTDGVPVAANGGAGVAPDDSDGDGIDDYLDLDSDNDGIADAIEAQPTVGYQTPSIGTDTDGDGVVDTFDSTTGHGGDFSTPEDTDGDGVADYLDDDSDNDGVDDIVESGLNPGADNNGDGIADNVAPLSFADTDGIVTDPSADLDNEAGDTSEVGFREIATDLVTVKTLASGDATPEVGDSVTFQIQVTNNGSFDATNVSLTDSLPAGLTFTGNIASLGNYNPATGVWTINTLGRVLQLGIGVF